MGIEIPHSTLVPVTFIFLSFIFPIAVVITLGMVIDRKSRNRRLRVFGRALGVTTGIYLFMISIDYLSGLLDRWS